MNYSSFAMTIEHTHVVSSPRHYEPRSLSGCQEYSFVPVLGPGSGDCCLQSVRGAGATMLRMKVHAGLLISFQEHHEQDLTQQLSSFPFVSITF